MKFFDVVTTGIAVIILLLSLMVLVASFFITAEY